MPGPTLLLANQPAKTLQAQSLKSQGANGLIQSQYERVFILDWDDTILPNCWLAKMGFSCEKKEERKEKDADVLKKLDQLSELVMHFLDTILPLGKIVIVTNALDGWVRSSCEEFLPKLVPYLEQVEIISARSMFQKQHPNAPIIWKANAFAKAMEILQDATTKQVFSFGDSSHEREALRLVTGMMNNVVTKSVKFVESPSIDQMIKQYELMNNFITNLCEHKTNLDLVLTPEMLRE